MKTAQRRILALLISVTLLMPPLSPFASAQTQSQVMQNAQRIYNGIVSTYGSVSGYVGRLEIYLRADRIYLDSANGYEEIYGRVINLGSAGVSIAVSILTGGTSAMAEVAGEEAFGIFVDEMSKDMPSLSLTDFI